MWDTITKYTHLYALSKASTASSVSQTNITIHISIDSPRDGYQQDLQYVLSLRKITKLYESYPKKG